MAISNELFMAILSMDSYNRGYNPGVNVSGNQIGNATVRNDPLPEGYQGVSFFAQAYTLHEEQTVKTVIAYRGTDQPGLDILNGYGTGAGFILASSPDGAQRNPGSTRPFAEIDHGFSDIAGPVGWQQVARMERSEIRGQPLRSPKSIMGSPTSPAQSAGSTPRLT